MLARVTGAEKRLDGLTKKFVDQVDELLSGKTDLTYTVAIEVVPPIRPGWAAGVAVTIGSPRCRAVMVPGSLNMGQSRGIWHEGISFDWTQTLGENP